MSGDRNPESAKGSASAATAPPKGPPGEVTSDNVGEYRLALTAMKANREKLVETLGQYPVAIDVPCFRVTLAKPDEVDVLIEDLETRIRDFQVSQIASEQERRLDP